MLISKPNTFSAGATILSAEHNENYDALFNLVNGNIDNNNIKSSAAIVDTKLAQISTASKVSGAALTGLASTPSGAGKIPFANIPSIDENDMASDSDTHVPTQQSVKAYADAITTAMTFNSIEDYGTSATTGSAKTQNNTHIAYGRTSVGGSGSQAITNLNFTSSTSYVVVTGFGANQSATEAAEVVQNSGSQFTLYNNDNLAQTINWIAIGI